MDLNLQGNNEEVRRVTSSIYTIKNFDPYAITITTWSSLCSVIGRENSRHSLNQSNAKLKLASTRAFSSLLVFTLRPIGSSGSIPILRLAFMISLVCVLRHSIEKRFNSSYHQVLPRRILFRVKRSSYVDSIVSTAEITMTKTNLKMKERKLNLKSTDKFWLYLRDWKSSYRF